MKTVTDFPPFAETARLHADLTNERDQLLIEQTGLLKQLAYTATPRPEQLSTEEAARRLVEGGAPPASAADRLRAVSERELSVRTRVEAINKVLRDLPLLLERRRCQARDAKLVEMAGDVEKVKADFEKARTAMLAAMLAENRILERLIVGGFGGGDPWLTAPHWLDRNRMIEVAAEDARLSKPFR